MRFHVRIGTLPHEAEFPQPLEIDFSVWRPEGVDDVLDYRRLHEIATRETSRERLLYLEDIANAMVNAALALPGVTRARAALRKPHVPLPGPLAYAEVVVDRASGNA